jgi:tetraacyldisaccharide 4'-kinase
MQDCTHCNLQSNRLLVPHASTIEKFWYSTSKTRFLLWPLLWPLSFFIALLTHLKRYLYRMGLYKTHSSQVPVLVVGNITVGGTGKTPFIALIVEQLTKMGLKVAIVSRGYKSAAPYYPYIVSSSDNVECVGDEAFMQCATLNVPMAIGADRAKAVKLLADNFKLDLIISDDGLQHYAMSRVFEIIMVDAKRLIGNGLMLPFGPLRESKLRLSSADYVIYNGEVETGKLGNYKQLNKQQLNKRQLIRFNSKQSTMVLKVKGLVKVNDNQPADLDLLNNSLVAAVAGIGHPQRFFNSLSQYNSNYKPFVFADHHAFNKNDFINIKAEMGFDKAPQHKNNDQAQNQLVIMTEKDAVKCKDFAEDNWYYLKVSAQLPSQDLEQLIERIHQKIVNS